MKERKHKPGQHIGIFLIILGLFLGGAMLDILNLGSFRDYFIWPMLILFVGVLVFFNSNAAFGIILVAVGGYFLLPRIDYELPVIYEKMYWPAAVILAGLTLIVSGIIRRYRKS